MPSVVAFQLQVFAHLFASVAEDMGADGYGENAISAVDLAKDFAGAAKSSESTA